MKRAGSDGKKSFSKGRRVEVDGIYKHVFKNPKTAIYHYETRRVGGWVGG